eukprot:TRINITY_DN3331_c0_g1_i2.p1 TRINITY_DN3331_c0_g1~~TRINITY_DN3331_c0_g1_i2.p1  ORF type:complete len:205 (-),score=55.67 TRINITY_DN3331_c0_g1_i2:160-774(-)
MSLEEPKLSSTSSESDDTADLLASSAVSVSSLLYDLNKPEATSPSNSISSSSTEQLNDLEIELLKVGLPQTPSPMKLPDSSTEENPEETFRDPISLAFAKKCTTVRKLGAFKDQDSLQWHEPASESFSSRSDEGIVSDSDVSDAESNPVDSNCIDDSPDDNPVDEYVKEKRRRSLKELVNKTVKKSSKYQSRTDDSYMYFDNLY